MEKEVNWRNIIMWILAIILIFGLILLTKILITGEPK